MLSNVVPSELVYCMKMVRQVATLGLLMARFLGATMLHDVHLWQQFGQLQEEPVDLSGCGGFLTNSGAAVRNPQ